MNLLTANLGNSRFSFAWFEGGKLLAQAAFSLEEDAGRSLASFLGQRKPQHAILCSVNPPAQAVLDAALAAASPSVLHVGEEICVPMTILCKEPQRVGRDRLVVAFEAWKRANGKCLVLDFGTAVTLNAVSAKGEFLGGAIAPGLGLAAKSLVQNTAQLPQVDLARGSGIIGRATEEAIAAGIRLGWVGLTEKWIEAAREELGADTPVFATGGDLDLVRDARGIDRFEPHLLHEGLARLAESQDKGPSAKQ